MLPLIPQEWVGGTFRGSVSHLFSWAFKGRGTWRCSPCTYLELRLGTTSISRSLDPYLSVQREGFGIWVGLLWLNCWSSLDSVEFLQFNHWSTAQNQTINPNGQSREFWMFSSVFEHSNKGFLWVKIKNIPIIFKNWTFELTQRSSVEHVEFFADHNEMINSWLHAF